MTEYYLATSGSDTNAGTSSAPWKSLTRLNAASLQRGDRVFLRRGDTFYGRLVQPDYLDPNAIGWLRYGAYGSGALPVISGYKIATAWTQHDASTWKLDYAAGQFGITHTGYDSAQGTGDVGFLKVDGVIRGMKRSTLAALSGQWDFYSSGTTLYVRSSANPATLAADIRFAIDGDGSNLRSAVELADVHITGHGAHGVNAPGNGGATRCRLLRCILSELGGSYLDGYGDGTVRFGNGFQAWVGSRNIVAELNTVRDVYDVAYTIQGGSAGVAATFTDITWRRNLTYRCSQAEEYWFGGAGPGFVNCLSEYNTNLFAGYGWGADTRPDGAQRCFQLTYDNIPAGAALTMRRNVYYDARAAFAYSSSTPTLTSQKNIIALRPGTKMLSQDSQTVEQAAAWSAARGRDTDSRVIVLPSSAATVIANSDITAAIAALDGMVAGGQRIGAHVWPIHGPWRAA